MAPRLSASRANDAPSALAPRSATNTDPGPCLTRIVGYGRDRRVTDGRVAHIHRGRCGHLAEEIAQRSLVRASGGLRRPPPSLSTQASPRASAAPACGIWSMTTPRPRAVASARCCVSARMRVSRAQAAAGRASGLQGPMRPRVGPRADRHRTRTSVAEPSWRGHDHRRRRVQCRTDAEMSQRRLGDPLEHRCRDHRAVVAASHAANR